MKTTIIILLILAGVSLNAIVGDNGVITNAMNAKIMSRFSSYKEELEMKKIFDDNIYATKEGIKRYIKDFDDSDLDKFVIVICWK